MIVKRPTIWDELRPDRRLDTLQRAILRQVDIVEDATDPEARAHPCRFTLGRSGEAAPVQAGSIPVDPVVAACLGGAHALAIQPGGDHLVTSDRGRHQFLPSGSTPVIP